MQTNYRVNLSFATYAGADLDNFTTIVSTALDGNASFPLLPLTLAALGSLQTTFHDALAAMAQGGRQATAEKNAARDALVTALRAIAAYVQVVAAQDLAMLLSSGFLSNSTTRTRLPLITPNIVQIDNGMSTELVLRLTPVENARAYEIQVKTGTTDWQPAGISTNSRGVVITGLTPGLIYTVQVRAIGGSTGYSDWSDPVSHMAM